MKNPLKNQRFFAVLLSVLVSVFLVAVVVYATTTIGSNISTGGTLSVTGASSLSTASTTGNFWLGNQTADDDDYLYMDASSTEYLMWDDSPGRFQLSDDLYISGSATTTGTFYITGPYASTTNNIYLGMGTASGDDFLYFDESGNLESLSWDDDPGEFDLTDDLNIAGSATTTGTFYVTGPYASTTNTIISGSATTTGNMVIGYNNQAATTTVTFGSYDGAADHGGAGVCFKIWQSGAWVYCYPSGGAFTCSGTSCE